MHKILTLLIFLASTIFGVNALPTEYRTGRLYDAPAVVSAGYTGFCQDKAGFIWMGTSRGLIRFDGNAYDVYRHEDFGEGSLSDSRILDVFCDSKGRVWVTTANGLNLYLPETDKFRVIELPSKSFYGYIIGIGEQADGTITFMASGVGLYVINFKDDIPEAVQYSHDSLASTFNTIVCCENGQIYFGVHEGAVYNMSPNGNLTRIDVCSGSYVVDMSLESDGNVLVATLNDIYRIHVADNSVSRIPSDGTISINKLSNCSGDKVYVATSDSGLWEVHAGIDRVMSHTGIYCPFVDLSKANIGAAYSAPDGNLWLGCNYKGVVMVPGQQLPFTYKKLADNFPDFGGGFSAMALWKENVVVALDFGDVGIFGPGGNLIRSVSFPHRAHITSIEIMNDDNALLGVVGDGVWQLNLETGSLKKSFDIPGKYPLAVMAKGLGDDIFVGIHGEGVMRYNMKSGSKEWLKYKYGDEKGFSNPFITSLMNFNNDKLWICSFSGLACYDLKTNKMLEVDQMPFLNGTTFFVVPISDTAVLVGTSQGLIEYDLEEGFVRKYTIADGLTDNDVRCMAVDKDGGVWIGTVCGLSYLPKNGDKIQSYYGGYGLVEGVFNHTLYSVINDRVYAGNDLGMTSFRPEQVPSPGFDKDVSVSAYYLNGERLGRMSKDGKREFIKGETEHPEQLILPYKDNALTLRISTLDFRDPSNISYRWRLHSKDEWIQTPPGENLIYLPHLDPGNYDFEICAVENNVVSNPTRFKISVSPPWYWNVWSKSAYSLILLGLLWLVWIAYKKKRDEKISEEKIKFFMDISHDLRSPLSLILSPLESLMKQPFNEDVMSKLNTMHRNVYRMLSLVNQLLYIRKLEKGKMHLHCRLTDVNAFVGELVEMFRPQAEDKKLTMEFVGLPDDRNVWIDRDNLDKILVNLVSNAIKYTNQGGNVVVGLQIENDAKLGEGLCLSVMDTGIGLDSKTEARLFERFYRVENGEAHTAKGFGIGLDLCRRLAELHHGSISGNNRTDGIRGSVFTVMIPLEENSYAEQELVRTEECENEKFRYTPAAGIPTMGEMPSTTKVIKASNKYVLFVDDDAEMRAYVASQLGKTYKVATASNGAEALKMMEQKVPDLIVSDVKMPEMDGLKLLKRLKSNTSTNHIPVILLSSKNTLADRLSGWEKGADAYVDKPFNIDELQTIVGNLIENRMRVKGKYSGAQDTDGKIATPEIKGNDEVLMSRILKAINDYIDDPELNVERLSSEVGVSRAHLNRKMKDLMGMSPSDYIRNIRLKRACELLKKEDIEVTQVAYKIGFTSQSHFSTHFKRYTGYSPSEYRARSKEHPA